MENPIKQIHRFNQEAGFLNGTINPWLESSYLIEEALEGFVNTNLARLLKSDTSNPKVLSRLILSADTGNETLEFSDVDILDKACDATIFAIGSMAKLGLNPNQITAALNIVMAANFKKLENKTVDSEGKLNKPENWEKYSPEPALQKILDSLLDTVKGS